MYNKKNSKNNKITFISKNLTMNVLTHFSLFPGGMYAPIKEISVIQSEQSAFMLNPPTRNTWFVVVTNGVRELGRSFRAKG